MRTYISFLLILLTLSSHAQFFKEEPALNPGYFQAVNFSYIAEQKIKSLLISYSTKEDSQRIKEKGIIENFFFATDGLPERMLRVANGDTTETFYYFTNRRLSISREFSKAGIHAIYFSYDSLGNKIKEVRCKEENAGASRTYFKLKAQQIEWNESYSYQSLSNLQIRRETKNDVGTVYKSAILYKNEKSNLTEESERYSVTGVSQSCKYIYDSIANITEKIFFTDVVGVLEEKSTFTYGSKQEITGEKFYRNGILLHEKIYFYDSKNQNCEAILTKYPDRKTIDMQNIKVEFY